MQTPGYKISFFFLDSATEDILIGKQAFKNL